MCFPQIALSQPVGSNSRLVRYAACGGPCFSSSPGAPSASCEPARRSCHPGSNFGSPVWPAKLAATHACGPYGSQPFGNSTGVERCDNREEKVPCSSDICVGLAAASSVPKSGGTSIGNRKNHAEENPPARKLKPAKKEEDFSANASKKMPANKILFQTGDFDPLRFHCWHAELLVRFRRRIIPPSCSASVFFEEIH